LEAACRAGLEDPAFRRVAASSRVVVNFMPRNDFARMVQDEFANYARILRDLGVKAE
jgi:tripartite-type tricarboxylate transporter receptor subunit TctC